jgi:hypothetical protein
MFKYNKSKIEAVLEEEKEVGHHQDRGANYGVHMNHPHLISYSLPISGVLHNHQ